MLRFVLPIVLLTLTPACTSLHMARCAGLVGDHDQLCRESINRTGNSECYDKHVVEGRSDLDFDFCLRGKVPSDDDRQRFAVCDKMIDSGQAETFRDCKRIVNSACYRFQDDPKAKERCEWAEAHPMEVHCEAQAEKHGGYWECMRLQHEAKARQEAAARYEQERFEQVQREVLERERARNAGIMDGISTMAGGNNANKQKTKCVSKRGYGDTVETECQ
jgi:hypothetical protein